MTRKNLLTPDEHAMVSDAVALAERETDGEIVTIVARWSDAYHDAALQYAVAASFLVFAGIAAFPRQSHNLLISALGGWDHQLSEGLLMTFLLGAMLLVYLIVRSVLFYMPLRLALTPAGTKARRVRRRAILLFRTSAESRTKGRTGVLLYLSLDEHRAEIVADAAINEKVAPEVWGEAMAQLIDHVRAGEPGKGMAQAVQRMGAVLAEHFPPTGDNPNELPDRLIEL